MSFSLLQLLCAVHFLASLLAFAVCNLQSPPCVKFLATFFISCQLQLTGIKGLWAANMCLGMACLRSLETWFSQVLWYSLNWWESVSRRYWPVASLFISLLIKVVLNFLDPSGALLWPCSHIWTTKCGNWPFANILANFSALPLSLFSPSSLSSSPWSLSALDLSFISATTSLMVSLLAPGLFFELTGAALPDAGRFSTGIRAGPSKLTIDVSRSLFGQTRIALEWLLWTGKPMWKGTPKLWNLEVSQYRTSWEVLKTRTRKEVTLRGKALEDYEGPGKAMIEIWKYFL